MGKPNEAWAFQIHDKEEGELAEIDNANMSQQC